MGIYGVFLELRSYLGGGRSEIEEFGKDSLVGEVGVRMIWGRGVWG